MNAGPVIGKLTATESDQADLFEASLLIMRLIISRVARFLLPRLRIEESLLKNLSRRVVCLLFMSLLLRLQQNHANPKVSSVNILNRI